MRCKNSLGARENPLASGLRQFLGGRDPGRSKVVAERLMRREVIVRNCNSVPDSREHCLRVTVGKPKENERFLDFYSECYDFHHSDMLKAKDIFLYF